MRRGGEKDKEVDKGSIVTEGGQRLCKMRITVRRYGPSEGERGARTAPGNLPVSAIERRDPLFLAEKVVIQSV